MASNEEIRQKLIKKMIKDGAAIHEIAAVLGITTDEAELYVSALSGPKSTRREYRAPKPKAPPKPQKGARKTPNFAWTDQNVANAKAMSATGMSAKEIATALGTTQSSVKAKLKRMSTREKEKGATVEERVAASTVKRSERGKAAAAARKLNAAGNEDISDIVQQEKQKRNRHRSGRTMKDYLGMHVRDRMTSNFGILGAWASDKMFGHGYRSRGGKNREVEAIQHSSQDLGKHFDRIGDAVIKSNAKTAQSVSLAREKMTSKLDNIAAALQKLRVGAEKDATFSRASAASASSGRSTGSVMSILGLLAIGAGAAGLASLAGSTPASAALPKGGGGVSTPPPGTGPSKPLPSGTTNTGGRLKLITFKADEIYFKAPSIKFKMRQQSGAKETGNKYASLGTGTANDAGPGGGPGGGYAPPGVGGGPGGGNMGPKGGGGGGGGGGGNGAAPPPRSGYADSKTMLGPMNGGPPQSFKPGATSFGPSTSSFGPGAPATPSGKPPNVTTPNVTRNEGRSGPGVQELQGSQARTRNQPLNAETRGHLDYAAGKTGLGVEVFSGGQARPGQGPRVGSERHDEGHAGDANLYEIGPDGKKRYLKSSNPADRAKIADFISHSVHHGATGVGHGPGYMSESAVHIGGTPRGHMQGTWGAGGRSGNEPQWVRDAYAKGVGMRKEGPASGGGFDSSLFGKTAMADQKPSVIPGSGGVGSAAEPSKATGGGSPFLAKERERLFKEMDNDPALRTKVARLMGTENWNDSQGPLEALTFRALKNGTTIRQEVGVDNPSKSFFGPIRRDSLRPLNQANWDKAEKAVRGGSNSLDLRTDQGMRHEHPYANQVGAEAARLKHINGEWYSDHGAGAAKWQAGYRKKMEAYDAAAGNNPGAAKVDEAGPKIVKTTKEGPPAQASAVTPPAPAIPSRTIPTDDNPKIVKPQSKTIPTDDNPTIVKPPSRTIPTDDNPTIVRPPSRTPDAEIKGPDTAPDDVWPPPKSNKPEIVPNWRAGATGGKLISERSLAEDIRKFSTTPGTVNDDSKSSDPKTKVVSPDGGPATNPDAAPPPTTKKDNGVDDIPGMPGSANDDAGKGE